MGVDGDVDVLMEAYPPDRRRRDLDNLLKASLDSITHSSVIGDDFHVWKLTIERMSVAPPGKIDVSIFPRERMLF